MPTKQNSPSNPTTVRRRTWELEPAQGPSDIFYMMAIDTIEREIANTFDDEQFDRIAQATELATMVILNAVRLAQQHFYAPDSSWNLIYEMSLTKAENVLQERAES